MVNIALKWYQMSAMACSCGDLQTMTMQQHLQSDVHSIPKTLMSMCQVVPPSSCTFPAAASSGTSSWSTGNGSPPAIGASSGYAPHRRTPRGPRTPSSWPHWRVKNTELWVVGLDCSRPYPCGYWLLVPEMWPHKSQTNAVWHWRSLRCLAIIGRIDKTWKGTTQDPYKHFAIMLR